MDFCIYGRERFFPIFVLEASKWQIWFLARYRVYHLITTNASHFSHDFQKTQFQRWWVSVRRCYPRPWKKPQLTVASCTFLWLRYSVWCFPGHKTCSSLWEIVLHVKWHNTLVPEHDGRSYQWEKTYREVIQTNVLFKGYFASYQYIVSYDAHTSSTFKRKKPITIHCKLSYLS